MKTEINDLNEPNQDNTTRLNNATLANEISAYLAEPFADMLEVSSLASQVKLDDLNAYFTIVLGNKSYKITVESN